MSAFNAGVGNKRGDELDGADRVVVSRDRVSDVVRIAVRVQDRNHWNLQPLRFLHGQVFDAGVEDEDGSWHAAHVLDAAQILLELDDLFLHLHDFFFLQAVLAGVRQLELHLLHFIDALPDGLEVREHPAEPALVDEEHVGAQGFFLKDLSGLPLGSDKQHRLAGGNGVADEGIGLLHPSQRLLKIDDVDAVAFPKEELLHLWVPPVRLVPEMDSCF